MKYIKEYLEQQLGLKPAGEISQSDNELGRYVKIEGKETGIVVSWVDYADFLEKKYTDVSQELKQSKNKETLKRLKENTVPVEQPVPKFQVGDTVTVNLNGLKFHDRKIVAKKYESRMKTWTYIIDKRIDFMDNRMVYESELETDNSEYEKGDKVLCDDKVCEIVDVMYHVKTGRHQYKIFNIFSTFDGAGKKFKWIEPTTKSLAIDDSGQTVRVLPMNKFNDGDEIVFNNGGVPCDGTIVSHEWVQDTWKYLIQHGLITMSNLVKECDIIKKQK